MNNTIIPIVSRSCGDCTRCCEGWLESTVHGHHMCSGKPCYYLGDGCTIYESRPKDPCQDYTCAWIDDEEFPMWMKPSVSNVIVTKKTHPTDPSLTYYDVTETDEQMDSRILNWLVHWIYRNQYNLIYSLSGKKYVLGSPDFARKIQAI